MKTWKELLGNQFTPYPEVYVAPKTFCNAQQRPSEKPAVKDSEIIQPVEEGPAADVPEDLDEPRHSLDESLDELRHSEDESTEVTLVQPEYEVKKNIFGKLVARKVK